MTNDLSVVSMLLILYFDILMSFPWSKTKGQ